jgi:hypothetical protein
MNFYVVTTTVFFNRRTPLKETLTGRPTVVSSRPPPLLWLSARLPPWPRGLPSPGPPAPRPGPRNNRTAIGGPSVATTVFFDGRNYGVFRWSQLRCFSMVATTVFFHGRNYGVFRWSQLWCFSMVASTVSFDGRNYGVFRWSPLDGLPIEKHRSCDQRTNT